MKKIILILLIIFITVSSASCYEGAEIDQNAYVVAIGFDQGKGNNVRVTLQFVLPHLLGSGGAGGEDDGGGGSSKNPALDTITIEASTVNSAIELANEFLSKKITLSHAAIMVMGSNFVNNSFERFWSEIIIGDKIRPDILVAVCEMNAEEFIDGITPQLDPNPAQFIQSTISANSTVYTANTSLLQFYKLIGSDIGDAGVTLCSLVNEKDNIKAESMTSDEIFNEKYMPDNLPKTGGPSSIFLGTGVFSDRKYKGGLDASESWMYLASINEKRLKNKVVEDSEDPGKYIGVTLEQVKDNKISIDVSGDKPRIKVDLMFQATLYSIQSDNTINDFTFERVEKDLSKTMEREFKALYEKLAYEYNSDLICFGKEARKKFLTMQEWNAYNWKDKYINSEFEVNVSVNIKRTNMNIFE